MQVEVRTAAEQRTITYGTAEDLQEGLELEGVNAFLTAQDRDAESVLHATVEAMWANETTTVIEVHPEPLKHTPAEASPIEWEPCGLPTAANPTDGAETQPGQGAEHTNQPGTEMRGTTAVVRGADRPTGGRPAASSRPDKTPSRT